MTHDTYGARRKDEQESAFLAFCVAVDLIEHTFAKFLDDMEPVADERMLAVARGSFEQAFRQLRLAVVQ